MKRKVNLVGKNTLTVSLPSNFVKRNSLQKGEEIDVFEEGNCLRLKCGKTLHGNVTIQADNHNRTSFIHALRYYYRTGANVITLKFTEPKLYYTRKSRKIPIHSVLTSELHRFIGMVIMEETNSRYVIKCIIDEDLNDYNMCFQKLFYNINEAFDKISSRLNKTAVQPYHDNFTRNANFCFRFLNKKGLETEQKTQSTISLIQHLELVMDIIESIPDMNLKIDSRFKMIAQEIKNLLNDYRQYLNKQGLDVNFLDKKRIESEKKIIHSNHPSVYYMNVILLLLRDIYGIASLIKD